MNKRLGFIFEKIVSLNKKQIGDRDKQVVIGKHFCHVVEEVGEMACCLRGKNDEPLMNEAVDTAICALAIALTESDGDLRPILDIFNIKLDKWNDNLDKDLDRKFN